VLSDAEVKKFWAATASVPKPFGAVLRLLLLTGCRLNEIARLQWEEVNGATLEIPGSRTKNHLPFVIPLSPDAQSNLPREVNLKNFPREGRISAFVFTTNGTTPISGWSKVKRRLDAEMGSVPSWRIHDLRRTAATGMASVGIQPHIIEAVLNHVSGAKAGVAGTYNRFAYAEEKREALTRWAAHIGGIVS
jgi:integrase